MDVVLGEDRHGSVVAVACVKDAGRMKIVVGGGLRKWVNIGCAGAAGWIADGLSAAIVAGWIACCLAATVAIGWVAGGLVADDVAGVLADGPVAGLAAVCGLVTGGTVGVVGGWYGGCCWYKSW